MQFYIILRKKTRANELEATRIYANHHFMHNIFQLHGDFWKIEN